MVQVTATRKIPYGRKHVLAGETFEASEGDARLFRKLGWATRARPAILDVPPSLQTMAAPVAAPVIDPEEEAAPVAPAHPQMYSRRDMVAEPLAGPTGEAAPLSLSRRGRPRKAAI